MIWTVLSFVWIAFFLAVVFGIGFLIRYGLQNLLHRIFGLKDARGVATTQTTMARVGLGTLPVDIDIVARLGSGAKPRHTLNLTILRPTLGLRLISLGLCSLAVGFVWFGPSEFLPPFPYAREALSVLILLAVLNAFIFEVRYDDSILEVSGFAKPRREYNWADLISVQDTGHYELVLKFSDGRKAKVFKHLVGIRDFLTIAHMYSEINHRT